jgi:hypothetical protein
MHCAAHPSAPAGRPCAARSAEAAAAGARGSPRRRARGRPGPAAGGAAAARGPAVPAAVQTWLVPPLPVERRWRRQEAAGAAGPLPRRGFPAAAAPPQSGAAARGSAAGSLGPPGAVRAHRGARPAVRKTPWQCLQPPPPPQPSPAGGHEPAMRAWADAAGPARQAPGAQRPGWIRPASVVRARRRASRARPGASHRADLEQAGLEARALRRPSLAAPPRDGRAAVGHAQPGERGRAGPAAGRGQRPPGRRAAPCLQPAPVPGRPSRAGVLSHGPGRRRAATGRRCRAAQRRPRSRRPW